MADEWMRFVEAGLPAPGFEQWLSEKLQTPHPMGRRPRQDMMRTYYGRMISETDDMDPVATRPLFRRAYFSNLYAHWLSRTQNAGGISMHAIARDLPLARQSPDNDMIDLLDDDASTSCRPKIATMGLKGCDPRMRSLRPHTQTTCMDGRQAKGNAPIAPITRAAKTKLKSDSKPRTQHYGIKAQTSKAPAKGINAYNKQALPRDAQKATPDAQPCKKKQRCIAECWAVPTHPVQSREAAMAPSQGPHQCPSSSFGLKLLCWSVMGLTTVGDEFEQLLRQQDPDIIILTETKLTERTQKKCCLNSILRTHWLQFSSSPHSSLSKGERQGSGGLAVAVRKSLVPYGCYERLPIQNQHRSHLLQVVLQPPNSATVLLQAVYMPFDHAGRASIYEAIKEACKGRHSIVAGDMNAALGTHDRNNSSRSALDKQHEVFMAQNVLAQTDNSHRPFSHTVRSLDSTRDIQRSRIDDILVTAGIKRHLPVPCTEVLQATDDSDHLPLLSTLEVGKVGFVPPLDLTFPGPQPEACPKLAYPIKKTQLLEFQACFQDMFGQRIHGLTNDINQATNLVTNLTDAWDPPTSLEQHNSFHDRRMSAANAAGISKCRIEALDAQLQQLLESALTMASEKLDTVKPKPDKRYLCRTDKERLMELIEQGKRARAEFEQGPEDTDLRTALHENLNILRQERHALTRSIRIANAKLRTSNFQRLVSNKPKLANQIINGKMKERVVPQVLRQQGSDNLLVKSADVTEETHKYFQKLNRAPCKRTHSYNDHVSQAYPWESQDALDRFTAGNTCWARGIRFHKSGRSHQESSALSTLSEEHKAWKDAWARRHL